MTEQTAKVAAEQHAAELARMTGAIEAERTRHLQEAEQLRAESVEQKKVNLGVASERDQVRADLAAITAKAEAIEQARQEQRQAAKPPSWKPGAPGNVWPRPRWVRRKRTRRPARHARRPPTYAVRSRP